MSGSMLESLPSLSLLTNLDVSRSCILDIFALSSRPNLVEFDYSGNDDLADISSLANSHKLTSLDLTGSRVDPNALTTLGSMTQLTSLLIAEALSSITDFSPLEVLVNLTELDVGVLESAASDL
jgi:hypothetical protein